MTDLKEVVKDIEWLFESGLTLLAQPLQMFQPVRLKKVVPPLLQLL
jgi:hypothetical protein